MDRIELASETDLEARLAQCLRRGEMPDCFLYIGDTGVRNWLALDSSDELPAAGRLHELLVESVPRIVPHLSPSMSLVSLGTGSGQKERILLAAMADFAHSSFQRYCAVDISRPMIEAALETAADIECAKTGIVAFVEDLPRIRAHWSPPALVCLLGNSFSNHEPDDLLDTVRRQLSPRDVFLFDCHLLPATGKEEVERVHGSRQNALFNMGPLLARGANLSDCVFHLETLSVETAAGTACRTCRWLDVISDCMVTCGREQVCLSAGSTIRLGFTYKHTLPQVRQFMARHGFQELEAFQGQAGENALILAGADC